MDLEMWIYLAKIAGALAGALISLVYLLPHTHREASSRFFIGVVSGLVFGGAVGTALAERFGIVGMLSAPEQMLMGSAAASLSAWWVLGALSRIAQRFGRGW
ncbi:hypothetical protein FJU11_00575 [Pararhizobium mangrovi]|uniref:Uncharacterized protein n=2 Tax=Pararhizobium mangrovi TaxID=2590452 RepID=A0A506UI34_9HYPH|nr:hypothetical protein FJU11_00575 [Pararhizobium mangrovi]